MKSHLYESIFILDSNTPVEQIDAFIEKVKKIVQNFEPDEIKVNRMGKNRMAYEIDRRQYGYYVSLEFAANPDVVKPLEEEYRLSDEILRFMTYRISTAQLKQRVKDVKRISADKKSTGDKDAS